MTTNGIETVDFEDVLDMMMLPLTYAHHPLPVDQPPMTADGQELSREECLSLSQEAFDELTRRDPDTDWEAVRDHSVAAAKRRYDIVMTKYADQLPAR